MSKEEENKEPIPVMYVNVGMQGRMFAAKTIISNLKTPPNTPVLASAAAPEKPAETPPSLTLNAGGIPG